MKRGKCFFSVFFVILSIIFLASIANAAAIKGKVWEDKNCNGVKNPGEKGIAGVLLTLSPGGATTYTDNGGAYNFTSLGSGTYTVTETDPAGYCSTTPNSMTVIIAKGKDVSGVDFGDAKQGISPPAGCCP